jgi:hypothetical protein
LFTKIIMLALLGGTGRYSEFRSFLFNWLLSLARAGYKVRSSKIGNVLMKQRFLTPSIPNSKCTPLMVML